MDEFDVLMVSPLSPVEFGDTLGPCRFYKLWQAKDRDGLIAQVKDRVRGIVSGALARAPINAGFMQQFPKLEIIAHMGVGYDLIDAKWAATRNIVVTHTPDVLTEEVADLSIGLLLATVRQIPQADRFLRAGKWRGGIFPLTTSLQGRRLGILGLGRIGKAIGKRAEARGAGIGRPMRRPHALHAAPLLIDEHRGVAAADQIPKGIRQRLHLRDVDDIALEQDQAPWLGLPDEGAFLRVESGARAATDEC